MTTRFTEDHEYIRMEGATGVVGITDYAQNQLGDIVFVELPALGKKLKKGDEAAVVESVKAASEIYAPVTGTVIEVNVALTSGALSASILHLLGGLRRAEGRAILAGTALCVAVFAGTVAIHDGAALARLVSLAFSFALVSWVLSRV